MGGALYWPTALLSTYPVAPTTTTFNSSSIQIPNSKINQLKLAAPKPVRARAAPLAINNATKWFQASPIKNESDQKNDNLLPECRRDSSVLS